MKKGYRAIYPLAIGVILLFTACEPSVPGEEQAESTQILWDEWGVPHIYAQNNKELFYSFGWAQMQSHGNLILKLYGRARGKGAEYWGEEYLQSDIIVHKMGFDELPSQWYEEQDPIFKTYIDAFVAGMNDFTQKYPERVDVGMRPVLPITANDVIGNSLYNIFINFLARGEIGDGMRWAAEEVGSNAYAIAPSRSASGNAMLLANPHLPWFNEWLFYEAHINAPGVHTYGATLVGLPVLAIAFNDHLGWTHTVNTIDAADLYELTLQDDGYVLDGEVKPFYKKTKVIKLQTEEGLLEQEVEVIESVHGMVLGQKAGKALALRIPGTDRPRGWHQWWKMGLAKNLPEFERAMQDMQLSMYNTIYADRHGEIFYLFNGQVPKRPQGDWAFWQGVIPGDQSALIWQETHSYADLPKLKNPEQGWLQNANDPPWTCTFPMMLKPKDFPAYMSPQSMSFRPQRSVEMIAEDESITFEELLQYKMSTHSEMADRLLDDLFMAVDQHGSNLAKEAKIVLENWDRKMDADSKGAWLFTQWAQAMRIWQSDVFAKPWSMDDPRNTPDGLADPQSAATTLEQVAAQVKEHFGRLDVPWGDAYRINAGEKTLPANGANGLYGVFRVAWPQRFDEKGGVVGGGDSYVAVIEFADEVRAKVVLSYGNSTEKNSPHNGDQLELFTKKTYRDAHLSRPEVLKHTKKIETLTVNGFEVESM